MGRGTVLDLEAALGISTASVFFLVLIIATYTDIVHHRIYNWCTFSGMAAGLLLNFLLGEGYATAIASLQGLALGFGIFFVCFLLGGFGAADMKLMGAVGAIMGYPFIINAMVWTAAVGAVMAIGALIWKERFLDGLSRAFAMLFSLKHRWRAPGPRPDDAAAAAAPEAVTIPYGLAIAIGSSLAFVLHLLARDVRL